MTFKDKLLSIFLGKGKVRGAFDYYFLFRYYKNGVGGPFNNQKIRRSIFEDIFKSYEPDYIIETGTFRAITTSYFASLEPTTSVISSEISDRYHRFSSLRMRNVNNVNLIKEDSRAMLHGLVKNNTDILSKKCFFYLDAHWYNDLPLREEFEIITQHWNNFIIMVDDFEVPGDSSYTYDDYGGDKILNVDYLRRCNLSSNTSYFFPSDGLNESGAKRGCVIVVQGSNEDKILSDIDYLDKRSIKEK